MVDTPPPSTAAHKLYISLPEGVAPPPGFKTSSYDSDISKWIYQRVPTAWSCASEAAGNPRCGGWCYNESRCTASFVEVPGLDVIHDSDCALHNAPAFPVGPCNCSVSKPSTAASEFTLAEMIAAVKHEAGIEYLNIAYAKEQQHHERVLAAVADLLSRLSAGEGGHRKEWTDAARAACRAFEREHDVSVVSSEYAEGLWDQLEATQQKLAAASAKLAELEGEKSDVITWIMYKQRAEQAEAKLAEAGRDAARYRWLRDAPHTNRVPHITQYPYQPSIDKVEYPYFTKVGLDAAIDAHLAADPSREE